MPGCGAAAHLSSSPDTAEQQRVNPASRVLAGAVLLPDSTAPGTCPLPRVRNQMQGVEQIAFSRLVAGKFGELLGCGHWQVCRQTLAPDPGHVPNHILTSTILQRRL